MSSGSPSLGPDGTSTQSRGLRAPQRLTQSTPAVLTPSGRFLTTPPLSLQSQGLKKGPCAGPFAKRMMGLEPTTFCMASERGRHCTRTDANERAFLHASPGVELLVSCAG